MTTNASKTLKWICLSRPIHSDMVVYKNVDEKRPVFETTRDFDTAGMFETTLHLPLHTGTHIDYPKHALKGGKVSNDFSLFPDVADVLVMDFSYAPPPFILPSHLATLPKRIETCAEQGRPLKGVFFKTSAVSQKTFNPEFPGLSDAAAAFLATLPLTYVGIDHLGIERQQPNHASHIALLEKDILIIEGLDLSNVDPGVHKCLLVATGLLDVEAEPLRVYKVD